MKRSEDSKLRSIPVDELDRNPDNPRLLFDQDRLDLLAESIAKVGILVPLLVYRDDDGKYRILDGERRWICAKKLNFKSVPANIIAKPNRLQNILTMFNIHNIREDWELMPTALKFEEVRKELEKQGITGERKISELTSLKVTTIRRCKILISLPKKYQAALLKRELKPDFFIEMETKALRTIEEYHPELYEKYGRESLIDIFLELREKGRIKSVTDFRYFQKVIQGTDFGLDVGTVKSLMDKVIGLQEMSLKESYETIEDAVNVSRLTDKSENLLKTFHSLSPSVLKRRLTEDEAQRLKHTLAELRDDINRILKEL